MKDVDATGYAILAAVIATAIAVVITIAWALGTLRQPRVLVQKGLWREAAIAAEHLGSSWLRIFPSVRDEALYARAMCLHLEGKLVDSLAAIRALPDDGPLAPAIAVLEGANLVMSGGDATRAVERLSVACEAPGASAEDRLFLALAELAAGNAARADAIFAKAGEKRPKGAPSPRIYEPAFHYLRALYLVRTGRAIDAAGDLAIAAASPVVTMYVERARALVPPRPSEDSDPRSSLTPQVIDE